MSDRHEHLARVLAGWLVDEGDADLRRVTLLVDLFPAESLEDLRRLAQFLHYTDAGALLEAALFLRYPGERPPALIDRVLRVARWARDETRADIYIALGPGLATENLDFVIAEAGSIKSPKARAAAVASLTDLKDLRLHPIAPPDAEFEPAEIDPNLRPDPSDVRLIEVVGRQPAKVRDELLREVLDQARHHGHPSTAAAPPPAAEPADEAVAPAARAPEAAPPLPPPPAPVGPPKAGAEPSGGGAPTLALPDIGGVLRSVGGAAIGAVVGVGTVLRDVFAPRRAAPTGGETAAPTIDRDIFGEGPGAPKTAGAAAGGGTVEQKRPVVNTGLASAADPAGALDPDVTLVAAKEHLFWLEIGAEVVGSIEVTPTGVAPELAKIEAELDVVLFDAGGSKAIVGGSSRGRLKLKPDGSAVVLEQPNKAPQGAVDPNVLEWRLLFPLRTPRKPSTLRFRCNLYHEGLLIQSRLVRCVVRAQAEAFEGALRSTLDYVLARSLTPDTLVAAGAHQVSILTNQNDGGTHGFYVAAKGGKWARSAEFDADELQDLVEHVRGALRFAAWGTEDLWNKDLPYRYEHGVSQAEFESDLIALGLRGYDLYDRTIDRLAAGAGHVDETDAEALATLMRTPSNVQIATHSDPRFLLPASMIYDRDLQGHAPLEEYSVCQAFMTTRAAAAKEDGPVQQADTFLASACFQGDCPEAGDDKVVCPSAMWGFRHSIGQPVSLESDEEWAKHGKKAWAPGDGDPPVAINIVGPPQFTAAISTDASLKWPEHAEALQKLRTDAGWRVAATLDETYELFKTVAAQVVYLYCHGGIEGKIPFLSVGPVNDRFLVGSDLRSKHVRWKAPRPLVFINGCHTADVQPERAHTLVSAFVTTARASGVIGTEITIFVPLAQGFAQDFFIAFFAGQSVGDAIRTARLALLAQSNPLGLAYTAYALSTLHLTGLQN